MHFLTANYIFPLHTAPVKDGILVVNDEGKIQDIIDPLIVEFPSSTEVKSYNGVICPGFVNAHCHLELSHLKGKLMRKKQLTNFISEIIGKRNASEEEIESAMQEADRAMKNEGIVAVGDISNSNISLKVKQSSEIKYHTFIEILDISEERTDLVFKQGQLLRNQFSEKNLKASIVPHASYSVTKKLLRLIFQESKLQNDILCIHNQETESEDEMFEKASGSLLARLQQINPVYINWKAIGKSSLQSVINEVEPDCFLQLVHNTFTHKEDMQAANHFLKNIFWCLCPNANLFIEDKIPAIDKMINENCKLTIGTDSLASNDSLSILSEMKTIHSRFPKIPLNEILCWSALNGARFLKMDELFGSFEKGKKPGVNLLRNLNPAQLLLEDSTCVEKIF